MALVTKLAEVLSGYTQNVDLTSSDIATNSVYVGGVSGTQLTKAVLDSLIANSHAPMSDNQNIVAGDGLSGGGSGATVNVAVDSSVVRVNGANAFTANQSMGGNKLTSLADPTNAQDAATKAYVDSSSGSASSAVDAIFRIENQADDTKKIAFDASNIATATTRTISMPDSNVDLAKVDTALQSDGSVVMVADLDAGGNKIVNLLDPSADQDAATKKYADDNFIPLSEKGANNGVATLDGGGKIPVAQLPSAVMTYEGTWNASTNSPTLADGVGDAGMVYLVSVAGSQDLGSGSITFAVGDWVVYNGSIWQKSINSNAVVSVNGSTGVVTVNAINELTGDITAGPASGSQSAAATIANSAVTLAKLASNSVDENKIVSTTVSSTGAITGGGGTKLAWLPDNSSLQIDSNAARIKDTAYDQYTITGGSGVVAVVQQAPKIVEPLRTGENFNANTLYAVRFAKAADSGFVAGRVYKADNDTTSAKNFLAVGLIYPTSSTGVNTFVNVVKMGLINVPSHGFTVGEPVWLDASGAVTATPPSTASLAVVKLGMVRDANNIEVQIQTMGIN